MSDNLSADFSELSVLAADLGAAPKNVGPNVRKALEVTARKVKDSARDAVRGRRHWKQAARSIDYELKGFQGFGVSVLEAEIGYNKESSGNLGNLMEFGAPGSKNRLRPGRELQTSLQKNRDDFVKGLGIAVDDSLKAAKL
jgi:hypothetical protein